MSDFKVQSPFRLKISIHLNEDIQQKSGLNDGVLRDIGAFLYTLYLLDITDYYEFRELCEKILLEFNLSSTHLGTMLCPTDKAKAEFAARYFKY